MNPNELEYGYCHCGCGEKTTIPKRNHTSGNMIKGIPMKFVSGHNSRNGFKSNEKHPLWKGENVKKRGLHSWIDRNYGSPRKCEDCGTTNQDKRYEWANISGKYKRDIKDFKRLCVKCHCKFDSRIGEGNGSSKLTEKEVLKIREVYIPYTYSTNRLAKEFNISQAVIWNILSRRTWSHI